MQTNKETCTATKGILMANPLFFMDNGEMRVIGRIYDQKTERKRS